MCVSHKGIPWNSFTFKRTWLPFKVKILQRKGRQFSLLTNFSISQTTAYLFWETHVRFSQKHFMKFNHFQKNVIIFQSKASTETRNSLLILTILWHIANRFISFQSITCTFLTKAFHEIHTFSKDRDCLSK